jgi:valyl-tRNA synthetase
MIDKYGTDALRLTLSIGNTPGNDLKFDEHNVEHNMLFVNKLWNASRFVSVNLSGETSKQSIESIESSKQSIESIESELIENYDNLMFHEKWILSRIRNLSDMITNDMEKYNFSEA